MGGRRVIFPLVAFGGQWHQGNGIYSDRTLEQPQIRRYVRHSYARFNLGQVVRPDNSINLDGDFKQWVDNAVSRGGKLCLRVMMVNPGQYAGPLWLRDMGWPGKEMIYNGFSVWHPDIAYKPFQALIDKLYYEINRRFGRYILRVDSGWWGITGGEKHFGDPSGDPLWVSPIGDGYVPFNLDTCIWAEQVVMKYLPARIVVTSLKRLNPHKHSALSGKWAIQQGAGFRIDGLTDEFHTGYWDNFMQVYFGQNGYGYIPDAMRDMGIDPANHWRKAPVCMEPGYTMNAWDEKNMLDFERYCRWLRPVEMNNKGEPIPDRFISRFINIMEDMRLNEVIP